MGIKQDYGSFVPYNRDKQSRHGQKYITEPFCGITNPWHKTIAYIQLDKCRY